MHIWAATLCLQTASGPAQCDSGAFCKSALSPAFSFVFNRSFAIDCNGNKGGWRASISEYTWAPEQRSECPLLPILAIDVGTAKKGEAHTVKQHYGTRKWQFSWNFCAHLVLDSTTTPHRGSVMCAGKGWIIRRGEERSRSNFWLLFQALLPSCCFFLTSHLTSWNKKEKLSD